MITDIVTLTNHYNCENCGNLFALVNKQIQTCPKCKSTNIFIVDDLEYDKLLKSRVPIADYKKYLSNKRNQSNQFVNLMNFKEYENIIFPEDPTIPHVYSATDKIYAQDMSLSKRYDAGDNVYLTFYKRGHDEPIDIKGKIGKASTEQGQIVYSFIPDAGETDDLSSFDRKMLNPRQFWKENMFKGE